MKHSHPARRIAPHTWAIDSLSGAQRSYVVDTKHKTCGCPHFRQRLAGTGAVCKHIQAVLAQQPFIDAKEKASQCTDDDIIRLLSKYSDDPIIGGALRVEREERRQSLARETELLEIFS